MAEPQRTLLLVKPDGVQRQLVGRVLTRFEERGLKLVGLKLVHVDRSLAEQHYAVHSDKTHVQVENLEDFVARFSTESDWKMIEADSEGWIKHEGIENLTKTNETFASLTVEQLLYAAINECPLPDDCRVDIRDRRGICITLSEAKYGLWYYALQYRPILTEQAEPVKEPEIPEPPECMWPDCACERHDCFDFEMPEPSERQLLDRLKAAHAQQIPDLEAELREVLASMGYDLVSRNPFTQQRHGAEGE